MLRLNTQGLPKVFLHPEAVGDRGAEAFLYIPESRHSASSLRRPSNSERVRKVVCQVKPLDEILAEIGQPVDLVKFDIESVEYEVFAASRLVHQVEWIVGELKGSSPEVERLIALFPEHFIEVLRNPPNVAYVFLKRER